MFPFQKIRAGVPRWDSPTDDQRDADVDDDLVADPVFDAPFDFAVEFGVTFPGWPSHGDDHLLGPVAQRRLLLDDPHVHEADVLVSLGVEEVPDVLLEGVLQLRPLGVGVGDVPEERGGDEDGDE